MRKLENAIDNAVDDFKKNQDSIFLNEKETLTFKYKSILSARREEEKARKCIVRNCENKSIKKSHSIQRSGSLKVIAEKGHVLHPKFNKDRGEIELIKVGINNASIFPGYCTEHENLFNGFESTKEFEWEEHLALQIYRTICKEIVICENQISKLKILLEDYIAFRNRKIFDAICKDLEEDFIRNENISISNFKFTFEDDRLLYGKRKLKVRQAYLSNFLYKINDAILWDLSKKRFKKLAYKAYLFDKEIPVAISGRANFFMKLNTKSKDIEFVFNVLPLKGKTYIFVATLKKFQKELFEYMEIFTSHPLKTINLIESWMIYGSDHWFLKPSIWHCINDKAKREILDSVMNTKMNSGNEFKLTIFNEMKQNIIKEMESNAQMDHFTIDFIKREKLKLTLIN